MMVLTFVLPHCFIVNIFHANENFLCAYSIPPVFKLNVVLLNLVSLD